MDRPALIADLGNRTALVTGGGSGIGLATVQRFARSGARVALNYLPGDENAVQRLETLRAEGLDVIGAPGDVSDRADCERMVAEAVSGLGGLDYLVSNAGVNLAPRPVPFEDMDKMTDDFWSKVLSVNLLGVFWCARAAAEALKAREGSIVNVSSRAAFSNRGSSIAYSATKAGVVSLTRNLARALSPQVRVNAIAPGLTETGSTKNFTSEAKKGWAEGTLLGRVATSEEMADVIFFLSVGASFVNAETIIVDGGSVY